jgi:hypothetical protein
MALCSAAPPVGPPGVHPGLNHRSAPDLVGKPGLHDTLRLVPRHALLHQLQLLPGELARQRRLERAERHRLVRFCLLARRACSVGSYITSSTAYLPAASVCLPLCTQQRPARRPAPLPGAVHTQPLAHEGRDSHLWVPSKERLYQPVLGESNLPRLWHALPGSLQVLGAGGRTHERALAPCRLHAAFRL